MNITIFLAQLWGPVLIAIAIGMYSNEKYYRRLYKELEKDSLAVLVFGMFAMTVGIAQVLVHNSWGSLTEGVISFLGWGTLVKGAFFLMVPSLVDEMGDEWATHNLIWVVSTVVLVVGVYLTTVAYFL